MTTGSKDIVSHPKIFQVISCSKQKDKNLDHWNSMPQVSEKCIVEKRNMAEVQDVQVQPVSEHVFYIGSVLVKFSSTSAPKEEAIQPNFRTPRVVGFSLERIPIQALHGNVRVKFIFYPVVLLT